MDKKFDYIAKNTEILRMSKHSLATFGVTNINYYFLSEITKQKTKIREGKILSERPKILIPKTPDEIFEGFGKGAGKYADLLFKEFRKDLRILEYRFKNQMRKSSVTLLSLKNIVAKINEKIDRQGDNLAVIIKGSDKEWGISLMKFIVEMTLKSLDSNITELREKGFFEEVPPDLRRYEIERLLKETEKNRVKIKELGRKLEKYGLFEEYEDRFFDLLKRRK